MTVAPTPKKHVLLIDNYDSFTWNLYQYLCQSPLCGKVDVFRNDEIDIQTIEKDINPDLLFISPGPGHPSTDAGISKQAIDYFKGKIPIFGVCMGQQCIVEVFGGDVTYAGEIVHGKTSNIKHDGKGVFAGVPQGAAATRYHSLAGLKGTLPDCLEITATTAGSPEVIMGVRHKEYAVEGVQFHPESILTEAGRILIDNVLKMSGGTWTLSGGVGAPKGKENILTKIYRKRVQDYEAIEALPGKSFADLQVSHSLGLAPPLINFYERLVHVQKNNGTAILGEFKRASPSKGDINITAHPAKQALSYANGGCAAISVLTEPNWFKGSLDDLALIRKVIETGEKPEGYLRPAVLRKEFIFSKYQILEARLAGADTVLLIVKMLADKALLTSLYEYSLSLGMVPLVEVNDAAEMKDALALQYNGSTRDPLIIGVNNRNLVTFEVDLNTTSSLVEYAHNSGREGDVMVLALSGISGAEDIRKYKYEDKVSGFLIGESLMRAEERGEAASFLQEHISV